MRKLFRFLSITALSGSVGALIANTVAYYSSNTTPESGGPLGAVGSVISNAVEGFVLGVLLFLFFAYLFFGGSKHQQ